MNIKALFLTEAGIGIGMGHVNRCLAVSQAFKRKKIESLYYINGDFNQNWKFQFPYINVNWLIDQSLLQKIKTFDFVIIDSYLADQKLLKDISENVEDPISIFDSKLVYCPKGVGIFASAYADNDNLKVNNDFQLLRGKDYLLFTDEFRSQDRILINPNIQSIGISLGGFVKNDTLLTIIEATRSVYPNTIIKIFSKKDESSNDDFINYTGFLEKIDYLDELTKLDLLITNGGISLNEAILLGIPSLSVTLAENQLQNNLYWLKQHKTILVDISDKDKMMTSLSLMKDFEFRKKMQSSETVLIDAFGADRCVDFILNKKGI